MRGFGTYAARETTYRDANAAFRDVLGAVLDQGLESSPRGKRTKELVGASFTLADASRNIVSVPERKLNHVFAVAEWMWILLGRNDVRSIARFNKNIAAFSDDGETFFGAYGPWVVKQLPYVVGSLKRDPDTRQAVLTIWQQNPPPTKDVPCTVALQFLLRAGKLHAVATMRSNDAWLGLPYDLFNFTRIQAYVAAALGVPVGSYTHQAASLHLYENNWEGAERALAGAPFVLPWLDVQSPALTYPFPAWLPEAFEAAADPARAASLPGGWLVDAEEPWSTYLRLLAYRTQKDPALVDPPYEGLMFPETGGPVNG